MWIQVCLFSFPALPWASVWPLGKEGSFANPSGEAGPPDPISPPPAPSWGPERAGHLLGATALLSDLCWFPLSPDPAAGGPASRMGQQPHSWGSLGCQHLAKPAPL